MTQIIPGIDLNPTSRQNTAVINIILWCTFSFVSLGIIGFIPGSELLLEQLKFTPSFPELLYQPWSIFSYIFMHGSFWHLFGNMLWLFFIGIILEDLTGKKYIWKLFIGGGIFGAFLWAISYQLFWSKMGVPHMVGASAGVSAIIIGTAVFAPQYRVYLFGILPVKLIWIAIFRVVFDLVGAAGNNNQGGFIAHLGGSLFGLLFVLHSKGKIHIPGIDSISNFFGNLINQNKKPKPLRKSVVNINRNSVNSPPRPNQDEIDKILDKINQSGYDSLTKQEKETLFRAGD